MENKVLKEISTGYKSLSNKELSNILLTLHNDFTQIKNHMLNLTDVITEISTVYDKVYVELQKRLKFTTEEKEQDDVNRY